MIITKIKEIDFIIILYLTQLNYNDVIENLETEFKKALTYSKRRKHLKGKSYYEIIRNLRDCSTIDGKNCDYYYNNIYIKSYNKSPNFILLKNIKFKRCHLCFNKYVYKPINNFNGVYIPRANQIMRRFLRNRSNIIDSSYYIPFFDYNFCNKCKLFIRTK